MDIRTAVWGRLANAMRLREYYSEKSDRYALYSYELGGLTVAAGSAAVAAAANATWPWVGPTLTVIVALLAAFFPFVRVHVWRIECEIAQSHWIERVRLWEQLWLELECDEAVTLDRVRMERAADDSFRVPSCPEDEKLAMKVEAAVYKLLQASALQQRTT